MIAGEPKFIRITRAPGLLSILPRCQRCSKVLRGQQVRWCSHKCRVWGFRVAKALRDYLEGAA